MLVYHVQRIFKGSDKILLTLNDLIDHRPLFMSFTREWLYPDNDEETFHLYEIKFINPNPIRLAIDDYFSLFEYDGINNKFVLTDKINYYLEQGYNIFMKEFKPHCEEEMFTPIPKTCIRSIDLIR